MKNIWAGTGILIAVCLILVLLLREACNRINAHQALTREKALHESRNTVMEPADESLTAAREGSSPSTHSQGEKRDLSSYVNKNTSGKRTIAIVIVGAGNESKSSLSYEVADLYKRAGYTCETNLLKSDFLSTAEFQQLCDGSSEIITALTLNHYADYLVLGKYGSSLEESKLVEGSLVCRATLRVIIISTAQRSVVSSFSLACPGNGHSGSQAEEGAAGCLIEKYEEDHSRL